MQANLYGLCEFNFVNEFICIYVLRDCFLLIGRVFSHLTLEKNKQSTSTEFYRPMQMLSPASKKKCKVEQVTNRIVSAYLKPACLY